MTLDELRTMIASSAPRDWSRIKDGFVSDPVPQNFPPGPEAPAALVVRASFGPKSLKLRVNGQVVREIHTHEVPLPPPVATEL
jgi:hypothetical protein